MSAISSSTQTSNIQKFFLEEEEPLTHKPWKELYKRAQCYCPYFLMVAVETKDDKTVLLDGVSFYKRCNDPRGCRSLNAFLRILTNDEKIKRIYYLGVSCFELMINDSKETIIRNLTLEEVAYIEFPESFKDQEGRDLTSIVKDALNYHYMEEAIVNDNKVRQGLFGRCQFIVGTALNAQEKGLGNHWIASGKRWIHEEPELMDVDEPSNTKTN
ncbi:MAG: hypothetical protein P4L16_07145 [Chlamydiales bacterium]|nr:hypothetical protein [Chlamydiales bacterium]